MLRAADFEQWLSDRRRGQHLAHEGDEGSFCRPGGGPSELSKQSCPEATVHGQTRCGTCRNTAVSCRDKQPCRPACSTPMLTMRQQVHRMQVQVSAMAKSEALMLILGQRQRSCRPLALHRPSRLRPCPDTQAHSARFARYKERPRHGTQATAAVDGCRRSGHHPWSLFSRGARALASRLSRTQL